MTDFVWKWYGGGCRVVGDDLYPCDDAYENVETGERVTVYSTRERHFDLPKHGVNDIAELYTLDGVKEA